MKPENQSRQLLGVTRSKAKMYEYSVAQEHHIRIIQNPARLFRLTIGILGDVAVGLNSGSLTEEQLDEFQGQLRFAAQFFDAYLQSRLDVATDYYLLLLGAASYYLCALPGSSAVLIKRVGNEQPDLDCLHLDELLLWLLQGEFATSLDIVEGIYSENINRISQQVVEYFAAGIATDTLLGSTQNLRRAAYLHGTPRQLLIADVISALVQKRYDNSARYCLPIYSDLPIDRWSDVLQKPSFIRELWPAQHLLGKKGVFRGKSATIQLPTSAGKTKSIEIIIRSAFLSGRADIAVIVAPFRSLCHEIKADLWEAFVNESVFIDDPSDTYQADFDIDEFLTLEVRKKILVITPEKLTYLLRHHPELGKSIRLLIYDEGHLFDDSSRGVTYELLVSSLKTMISKDAQSILISAVISNAASIGEWLNGDTGEIVIGNNLSPAYRTIAFASWEDQLGRLEFVDQKDPDVREFFVPRIIEQNLLNRKPREKNARVFPERTDGSSIALYLGIKLVPNGSIAIFCGRKDSVISLCTSVVDIYARGLQYTQPVEYSTHDEVSKLHLLHESHMGSNNDITQCARMGIFTHSRNTPEGLRFAIEHAMHKGLIKFVICTSTLAQGVNLPIRYLIVTSIHQAGKKIKVRDFHNLIGRAGRSGIHTEGTILFADPDIYDRRNNYNDRWRWTQIKELLDPSNSEPCASTLLSLFDPWYSDDNRSALHFDPLTFVNTYVNNPREISSLATTFSANQGFSSEGIERQIERKIKIIASVESYLMAHWDDTETELQEEDIVQLATDTFAYYLSNDEQKNQIIELFKTLGNNIRANVPDPTRRKVFGKMLYGVHDAIDIEQWVQHNLEAIIACDDESALLITLWPILYRLIQNKNFKKCSSETALLNLALRWIQGVSFQELFELLVNDGAQIIAGSQMRQIKLEHVIEICENALAYDGMLVMSAIIEIIGFIYTEIAPIQKLSELQKRLKYGVSSELAIMLYELGFSDRIVATDLSSAISVSPVYKRVVSQRIRQNETQVRELLSKYPSYFLSVLDGIISNSTLSE